MDVDMRFHRMQYSHPLREYAVLQMRRRLGRFGPAISAVMVRMVDVNGPKGGLDKRCVMMVEGPRVGRTTFEEYAGDAYAAVDRAIDRVRDYLRRSVQRARTKLRRVKSRLVQEVS